jgi:hypothetical protein
VLGGWLEDGHQPSSAALIVQKVATVHHKDRSQVPMGSVKSL